MATKKKVTRDKRAKALLQLIKESASETSSASSNGVKAMSAIRTLAEEEILYVGEEAIRELISKLKALQWQIQVVAELPETGEERILYLVPVEDIEEDDIYAEYIWVNESWEKLGTKHIQINLDDYYTKEDVQNLLATKANVDDVYDKEHTYNQEEIDEKIALATGGGLTDVEAYGEAPLNLSYTKSGSKVTINGNIDEATQESAGVMSAEDKTKLDSLQPMTSEHVYELWELSEEYYGIEFLRGTSNQGGDNGYYRLIGNPELQKTLPVHNMIRCCAVKDGVIMQTLQQMNFFKDEDGNEVDLAGADGSDIVQTLGGCYAIMGGTDETYDRFIVSLKPFTYGNDVAQYVPLFGESVDFSTVVSNQQRCIYDTSVAGSMGTQNACITEGFDCYKTSAGYPKTSTSRFNYELYARNKNDDNTKNAPYCNNNSIDFSFILTLIYIELRTKWLTRVWGNGISSNVTPTADTWGTRSGARITSADGTVRYYTLGSTALYIEESDSTSAAETFANGATPLFVKKPEVQALSEEDGDIETLATANGTYLHSLLEGDRYPMLTIMEAQRDISNGCVEGTFTSVTAIDGTAIQGADDGVMTGIWTKTMSGKILCAFDSESDVEECDIDVVLCVPVWRGRVRGIGANIMCWMSGIEVLLNSDEDGNIQNILFQAKNIDDITTDTDTSNKSNMEDWAFTSVYENLGDIGATRGWATQSIRNAQGMISIEGLGTGGARETYEGCYRYVDTSASTQGVWIRRAVRFGGSAYYTNSVLRYASSSNAPSLTSVLSGCGFRVTLE